MEKILSINSSINSSIKALFFILFLFSITTQAQSILDRYEGIPIETSLDWAWVEDNRSAVDKMDSAGVNIVHISFKNQNELSTYFLHHTMDVLPITTPNGDSAVYNWIQYYTDAKYSVWEAEGTQNNPTAKGNATLYRNESKTDIDPTHQFIKLNPDSSGDTCTMSWGPYHLQDIEYETYADGGSGYEPVKYTADFKLKLECIEIDNAAPTDTLCILQVTQSTISVEGYWHIDCTDTIRQVALTRQQFTPLNTFNSHKITDYTLRPTTCQPSINNVLPPPQYHFSTDFLLDSLPPGPRSMCERIEYRVIWTGDSNYTLSYDKVIISDERGTELFGENSLFYRNMVIVQANSLENYKNSVSGWLGIDEPQSIDQYEPIRVVDSLLKTNTQNPRPIVIPIMGCTWAGTYSHPNDFGAMGLNKYEEMKLRIGDINIIQNAYMFDIPCNSENWSEYSKCNTGEDIRSINISSAANDIYKHAYQYFPNFGASLQCGAVKNGQADQRNPARHELLYSANLALMYGAKFLQLWRYFPAKDIDSINSGSTYHGIVDFKNKDITQTIYTDKYFMLRDTLSPRMKGLMGKTLKQLVPDSLKILGNDILVHPDYSSSSTYIDYIESVGSESDTCVIDLGFFTDPADNSVYYFMPINRYYSTLNYLTFGLKNLSENSNWKITDFVDTTQFTALSVNGLTEYTDTITPGDAKLYSIAPVVKYGGLLAYNDTIKTNTTLFDNMTIDAGKVLQINEGKTYSITDTITFTDTSSFITGYGYVNRTQNGWITTRSWIKSLFKGRSGSHPKLIWTKHPDITNVISYNIYRNHSNGGWQYLTTKSSSTFEYIDSTITIIEGMPQANETSTQYRITATHRPTRDLVETSPSNTILYHRVEGQGLEKQFSGLTSNGFTYNLNQNYPNPFNPTTTINYSIAEDGIVTLEILNILGERIKTMVNEFKTKGNHNISFNASSLASGVYVYKLQAGDFISSKKMILLK